MVWYNSYNRNQHFSIGFFPLRNICIIFNLHIYTFLGILWTVINLRLNHSEKVYFFINLTIFINLFLKICGSSQCNTFKKTNLVTLTYTHTHTHTHTKGDVVIWCFGPETMSHSRVIIWWRLLCHFAKFNVAQGHR